MTATKSSVPWHARQGDILVVQLDDGAYNPNLKVPETAKPVAEPGNIVLAFGTSTGHAHAIPAGGARRLKDEGSGADFIVDVTKPLVHDEHDPIPLNERGAPGFLVLRQVEYTPQGIRRVDD